jgi:hypothetical protein
VQKFVAMTAGLLLPLMMSGADPYLFTSFRSNGETGVFAALSEDGKTWTPIKGDQPWIKPEPSGMLMRDPWLGQGPDGVWHMLWTWGWTKDAKGPLRIGHTSSKDLVNWSPQEEIRVLEDEPEARNAWVPEAVWDPGKREWVIFWATTIPGRFAATDHDGDNGYNHRIYATRTRDWKTFTKSELFFDPGYSAIDSTIVHDGDRWIMIFKDERKTLLQKRLRLAFAASPQGPWTGVTAPFSGDWVEGPTSVRIGDQWWIYFDHYAKPQHYGAMITKDWKSFEDVGDVKFVEGQRHGTVVRIPAGLAAALK